MTTLLLFSLPWGYLIAALFLLAAIILFIIAIFMKDTGENYEGELDDGRYDEQESTYDTASYNGTFDRYQTITEPNEEEENLKDIIAETSENLGETKMFKPVVDLPEPEPYEEPIEVEEIKEETPEELYEAPASAFEAFAEPEEVDEEVEDEVEDEDADVKIAEVPVEEAPVAEEPIEEVPVAEEPIEEEDADEFDEVVPPKKPLFSRPAVADEDDDVPKPAAKPKSGMSFAEEVRRLIEEEERRNKNS